MVYITCKANQNEYLFVNLFNIQIKDAFNSIYIHCNDILKEMKRSSLKSGILAMSFGTSNFMSMFQQVN